MTTNKLTAAILLQSLTANLYPYAH